MKVETKEGEEAEFIIQLPVQPFNEKSATNIVVFYSNLFSFTIYSQFNLIDSVKIDSLKKALLIQKEDTNKINTLNKLSFALVFEYDFKNSMKYAREALLLAERIKYEYGVATAHFNIGSSYHIQDSLSAGPKTLFRCIEIFS